jgi:hypothetical protein
MEGKLEECRPVTERLFEAWRSRDPCGTYYMGRHMARLGLRDRALSVLHRSVEGGFYTPTFLASDPWLDSLRGDAEFESIVQRAQERHGEARRAFVAAGGQRILGLDA